MILTQKQTGVVGRAFTILELIVAVSITVLMLFLINSLFVATSNGVSMGMALSDVIGAGRAIGDQIERDVNEQFSPVGSPPGVLVIICERRDMPYKQRAFVGTRSTRTDQFMFTRAMGNSANGFGSAPITPMDNANFSSAGKTQMAGGQAMRLWYGHVLKTNDAGTAVTDFGAEGRNKLANQLALGRHALIFVGGLTPPTFNHALGARADSLVSTHVTKPGGGVASLFHGTTDVAYLAYADATAASGTFLGPAPDTSANPNLSLWANLEETLYDQRALAMMFTGANRLWTNPFPKIDATQTATWVTAGQIAQMHPLLMDNVSDFIVEFAADAVDDPIPNNSAGFDGEADRDSLGELIWYGHSANPDTNTQGPPSSWNLGATPGLVSPVASAPAGSPAGSVAYVFRQGEGNQHIWPYMLRIRYRIHDSRAELGGDKSPEPDATTGGRWFEQIIKIKRE